MVKSKRIFVARVTEEIPVYGLLATDMPGFGIHRFHRLNVTYRGEVRTGYPPHRHLNFEMFWVTEGQAETVVDLQPYSIGPMSLYIINPGEVHNFTRTVNLSGMLMQFSPAFVATLDSVLPEPVLPTFWRPRAAPILSLLPDEQVQIGRIFENLYEDSISSGLQKQGCLLAHLLLLLCRARHYQRRQSAEGGQKPLSLVTRRFQAALCSSCPPMVSVKQFAESLGVSRSFLHRTVAQETGRSPSELIHERLMVEAKRQLLHTNSDLAFIAHQIGFGDASYFGRFFSRHAQVSPNRFRRDHCLAGPV